MIDKTGMMEDESLFQFLNSGDKQAEAAAAPRADADAPPQLAASKAGHGL
jgi:hypothetical protein